MMQTHAATTQQNFPTSQNNAPRYDMYLAIHKAMRAFMSDTLEVIGCMDSDDDSEVAAALSQLRELLHLCEKHMQHENRFVHPAMEQRRPGSSVEIAAEHIEHEREIEQLHVAIAALETAMGVERRRQALNLYRAVALFVAHNFLHMHQEEIEHNAILWSIYTDAELLEIEAALKASIAPQDMAISARWMLYAHDQKFRVTMLSEVRAHAPRDVFEMLLGIARATLSERDWKKLANALELPLAA